TLPAVRLGACWVDQFSTSVCSISLRANGNKITGRHCVISQFPRKQNAGCVQKRDSPQSVNCKTSSMNAKSHIQVPRATPFYRCIHFQIIPRALSATIIIPRRADRNGRVVQCHGESTGIHRFTASRRDTTPQTTSLVFHSRAKPSIPPLER